MADEPDSLVLQLLRQIRADMVTKAELAEFKAELKSDIKSLRADVASDLAIMQGKTDAEFKQVREQIVGLRRAVVEYHSAVIGHGILISDLEARTRRIEQHLNLPAMSGG
jgi:myosin heavy subunit